MTDAEARIWQRYAMAELYGDKEGMESDQPDLFNLPPTRIQDVTLRQWDRDPSTRLIYHRAPACIGMMWWAMRRCEIRGHHRAAAKINSLYGMSWT